MWLVAMLIERSIEELQRRGVLQSMPRSCEIEQHNRRVWSVTLYLRKSWIVFLDTESGEPEAYHVLPLSVWNSK